MPDGKPIFDYISSTELLGTLVSLDSRPWGDWKAGKPMSAKALANELKPFGIFPGSDGEKRGYAVHYMVDVFARYLDPQCVNVPEPQQNQAISSKIDVSGAIPSDTSKNQCNPMVSGLSDPLTDQAPPKAVAPHEPDPDDWQFQNDDAASAA